MAFPDWIREVVAWLRAGDGGQRTGDRASTAISQGLAECNAAGVALVGDIETTGWDAYDGKTQPEIDVVVLRELLGLASERIEPLLDHARKHISVQPTKRLHAGISPHAPYSAHPNLVQKACDLSIKYRAPLAMHLAESRAELELLHSHAGPLVELLKSLGAWHPDSLPLHQRPLDYLKTLATAHRALVIHGNYLAADEINFLAEHRDRMSLVYCPRTHAYFGHDPYPLADMLKAGVRVAVGTDSLASNPDLKLFEELRHIAHHHPGVSPDAILRMGTLSGAEALGLVDSHGSITPGKRAALLTIPLTDPKSPLESILHTGAPQLAWFDDRP
jgi:cytosine/adenosine deaminase-related metal-dependent hydrolase